MRVRYGRGPSRIVKWLLDPFAAVGVYLLLVTFVVHRGGKAPGLSLACAVIPFQLVMNTVINAFYAIDRRHSILLNLDFNRTLIPVSSVITETVAFGASLVLAALMMGIYGVAPTSALLWLPVVIAVTLLLGLALAFPATLFGIWFPDLLTFAASFIRTLFFLAPGLVPLSEVGGHAARLLRLNPLTGLFESYRDVLLYGQRPALWQLLYPAVAAAAILLASVPVYRREEWHFAKIIEA